MKAPDVAAILTIILGSIVAFAFYQTSSLHSLKQDRLSFEAQVMPRYSLISSGIEKIDLSLSAIGGFISVSSNASETSFRSYVTQLGVAVEDVELCWISSFPDTVYSTRDASMSACGNFSPMQTSQVFLEGKPRAMLSVPVYGDTKAKGFVAAEFPFSALLDNSTNSAGIHEYLVLMDTSRNYFQGYSFSEEKIIPIQTLNFDSNENGLTLPLKRIGIFDFVYVARPIQDETSWFAYGSVSLSMLVWSWFFAVAMYIRAILSQKSEVENQVEIRTEELSQFAFRASHDLKSPLSNIGGLVRFAREDANSGNYAELHRNLEKVAQQVKRLEGLVSDILDLAMSDVKARTNELVDLNQLVRMAVANNTGLAKENDVSVQIDLPELPHIQSNNIRLVQIMDNVIGNAIKYSDSSKEVRTVTISAEVSSRLIDVRVKDNGIGIPDHNVNDAFKVFTRFHPNHAQGSGLGLSIVQRHIEKLDGAISIDSNVGQGTTFTVSLPKR